MAGEEGAAAAAAASAAAAAAPAQWFAGADTDTTGFLQNRGWDKLDPKDAALQAVKSYREAEKHIGAPPDQLLRIPKDANDKENWGKIWSKLGVPADAKDYDFSGAKFTDGAELDANVANALRTLASEQHLPKDAAAAVAKAVVKLIEEAEGSDTADYNTKLDVEKGTLRTNWGSNAAAYKVIAENAAQKLGVTADEIGALEKTIGYARVMDMFRNIGQRIGEDQFINGGGGPGIVMTLQQAEATLTSRQNDSAWVTKLNSGDSSALQEFHNLTSLIAAAKR